jgi:MoxR-like ATPase
MVSVGSEGHRGHPSRDARSLASGRLSSVLALEVALVWRAAADAELRAELVSAKLSDGRQNASRACAKTVPLPCDVALAFQYMALGHLEVIPPLNAIIPLSRQPHCDRSILGGGTFTRP